MSLSINDFYNFTDLYDVDDELIELSTIIPNSFNFINPSKYINYNGSRFRYNCSNNKITRLRKIKYCVTFGCQSQVAIDGKCAKHYGYYRCKITYCNKRSQVHGLCASHGGYYTCILADCNNKVKHVNDLCMDHLISV